MYGSSTENVVLRKHFLGIIWDLWERFSARSEIQSLNPHRLFIFKGWFWELVLKKLFNNDDEKCSKNCTVN